MDKRQEDTLNMYQATDGVLEDYNAVWTTNTPFSNSVDGLRDGIDEIEDLRDQQELDITGITVDKENKRKALEDDTFTIGSIVAFYASATNNRELLEVVDFPRSTLRDARDNEVSGYANQVHKAASDNALALAPYGITPAMITNLQTTNTAYVDYIKKPRKALSKTSAATEKLPPVFDAVDKILREQLDRGMELYRVSNNDFYTEYFNARIIVDSPTLTRALQVKFLLFDETLTTSTPVARMKVTIDGTIHRRSTKLGNIYVQNLTEGLHHLEAELPGYNKASVDFNVINGETTKLTVKWKDDDPTGSRGGRGVIN